VFVQHTESPALMILGDWKQQDIAVAAECGVGAARLLSVVCAAALPDNHSALHNAPPPLPHCNSLYVAGGWNGGQNGGGGGVVLLEALVLLVIGWLVRLKAPFDTRLTAIDSTFLFG